MFTNLNLRHFAVDTGRRGETEETPRAKQNSRHKVPHEEARADDQPDSRIRDPGDPKRGAEIANSRPPEPEGQPAGPAVHAQANLREKHPPGHQGSVVQQAEPATTGVLGHGNEPFLPPPRFRQQVQNVRNGSVQPQQVRQHDVRR